MAKKSEFHHYLRELRNAVGLAQEDVAEHLGYASAQFISNWERGISHPPMNALPRLAQLYKVPTEELYTTMEKAIVKNLKDSLRRRFLKAKL